MPKITSITRTAIKRLLLSGIKESSFLGDEHYSINYCGIMSEVEFLSRLYDLKNMPSYDSRHKNAEADIACHTNFDDYPLGWVFDDERFNLRYCGDADYLKFICEIFHPEVRDEDTPWRMFYRNINELLQKDGYELYERDFISGQAIYGYRILCEKERMNGGYIPFSIRYNDNIINKQLHITIPKKIRYNIYETMTRHSVIENLTDETGWNYTQETCEAVFSALKSYYPLKSYNEKDERVDSISLEQVVKSSSPYKVFDAIELFARLPDKDSYIFDINNIVSELGWNLTDYKMMLMSKENVLLEKPVKEDTLSNLLENAENLFNSTLEEEQQLGVEKLWDAFERLKTYYCESSTDKKKSVEKLIHIISVNNKEIETILNKEFVEMTCIGNNFQIRHFEKNKIAIPNDGIRRYFFNRCSSLINYAIGAINKNEHQNNL